MNIFIGSRNSEDVQALQAAAQAVRTAAAAVSSLKEGFFFV